jgi:hypothetical protein
MSLGLNAYHRFKELEETCEKLGFQVGCGREVYGVGDFIALVPRDEKLPAYSRDAVIYRGDLDGCLTFLHGWQQSQYYLEIIGAIKKGTVVKAEQKHLEDLESQRTIYAIQNGKDPGDLRKKANKAKLEEDDAIPF